MQAPGPILEPTLLAHDASGVAVHRRPEITPRQPAPPNPANPAQVLLRTTLLGLATAAEQAVIGLRGTVPLALVPTVAGRAVPLGLTEGEPLIAAAARPGSVADGDVLQRGKTTLAPVVIAARAAAR